jgi:hypothetical protein
MGGSWALGVAAALAVCGCFSRVSALCEASAALCPDLDRAECRARLEAVNNRSLLDTLEACLNRSRSCPATR